MKKLYITAVLVACTAFSTTAFAKEAKCKIFQYGTMVYNQTCKFTAYQGGSFTIQNKNPQKLIDGRVAINVEVVQANVAEVRGETVNGINSLWGTAIRSTTDRACWVGEGEEYKICVHAK